MTRVKVVDSIMGSGKTSAVINMVNRMEDDKPVMFITPFLTECERFRDGCTEREIRQPESLQEFGGSKLLHLRHLVENGYSIASTHALFKLYIPEILAIIKEKKYILIMDEAVDVVKEMYISLNGLDMLERAGLIEEETEDGKTSYRYIGNIGSEKSIKASDAMAAFCRLASTCRVFRVGVEGKRLCYYALIQKSLIQSFSDVYILTYMFEASEMCLMFRMDGIEWQNAYVKRVDYGNGYDITDEPQPMPEYVKRIPELVNIYQDGSKKQGRGQPRKRLNQYPVKKYGMIDRLEEFNTTWSFYHSGKRNEKRIMALKSNLLLFLKRERGDLERADEDPGNSDELCMWSVYGQFKSLLRHARYDNGFVAFNSRATNEYADRCYLAYMVNIYARPQKQKFFEMFGIEYPNDEHALSTMLQWIWRSRIRRGEKIWVYIPSKRMRDLLREYLDTIRDLT